MRRSKAPAPAPPEPTGPRLMQPLSIRDRHAMVAKVGYWAPFHSHPFGFVSPGLTWVAAGQLAHEASALVLRARDKWRRPTAAERRTA